MISVDQPTPTSALHLGTHMAREFRTDLTLPDLIYNVKQVYPRLIIVRSPTAASPVSATGYIDYAHYQGAEKRANMETYRTKREIAVSLLRNSIVTGKLTPGTRLILEDLASQYDLSLTPIREAMPVLEAEGLIVQVPHRGAIVAPMDRDEIMELYGVRRAIEGMVTRHAVPNLTENHLRNMEESIVHMESSIAEWTDFLGEDMRFHRYLYEAAGSSRWINTITSLWNRSARYMLTSTAMVGAIDAIHKDHRDLLAACRKGDSDRAEAIIEAHLSYAENGLLEEWIGSGSEEAKAGANHS